VVTPTALQLGQAAGQGEKDRRRSDPFPNYLASARDAIVLSRPHPARRDGPDRAAITSCEWGRADVFDLGGDAGVVVTRSSRSLICRHVVWFDDAGRTQSVEASAVAKMLGHFPRSGRAFGRKPERLERLSGASIEIAANGAVGAGMMIPIRRGS